MMPPATESTRGAPHLDAAATPPVAGRFDPAFQEVAEAFAANFARHGELGASLCIRRGDEPVVDLWGGVRDPASRLPWEADTVSIVFSSTKGATALCAHLLAAQGLLDLDTRVRALWPRFAQAGKADITVRMLLDHSAGIPVFRDAVKAGAMQDAEYLVERLENERPMWTPGTAHGYHAVTFGIAIGEIVRRVTGRSLGRFFDEAIARPLGLDFWIGLPERIEGRVATIVPAAARERRDTPFLRAARDDPASVAHGVVFNSGDWPWRGVHTRAGRAVEIGSAGGVTHARALAKLYAALLPDHGIDGCELDAMTDRLVRRASRQVATHDATLLMRTSFADGFMLHADNRTDLPDGHSLLIGESAFGHAGSGGSIGFVDVRHGFAFAYTMNRLGPGVLLNHRAQALIDATYRVFDRSIAKGVARPTASAGGRTR